MGKIRSTLDIVMERTRDMSMSREDKDRLKDSHRDRIMLKGKQDLVDKDVQDRDKAVLAGDLADLILLVHFRMCC